MNYKFFQRPALVFTIAALSGLTFSDVPIYVSSSCVILWAWKWLAEKEIVQPLSRKTTTLLGIIFSGLLFFQYRSFLTQESSSALLVFLSAIKVMDYENRRDHLGLILLGFMLLTLKPLYGMDLYWLPVQVVCMITLWWALSQDPRKIPRTALASIYATALPITLFLFFVFPRIILPWGVQRFKTKNAHMGYSQDMKPGQVSELAASNELVFRVRFLSQDWPSPREMYWKGSLLTESNGLAWKRPQIYFKNTIPPKDQLATDIKYEIILEPGYGNTLFTLDPTGNLVSSDTLAFQYAPALWRSFTTSPKSVRYIGSSQASSVDLKPPAESDLQTPQLPAKTEQWVRKVRAQYSTLVERRAALHDLFAKKDFTYTLTPGLYQGADGLDEFLFDRRRGFCEHFAGAYATLARALGIPARVVSGYQGADYNSLGNFWRITQRNAHAWAEIWDGGQWVRQDPTLWVPYSEFSRTASKSAFNWVDRTVDFYETMNYRWATFLIDFDKEAQKVALREWLPKIFFVCLLVLAIFFVARLGLSWFFRPGNKTKNLRYQQLAFLILQIKEAEEEFQNQDLSHWPPIQILKSAQLHLLGGQEFYSRLIKLYDRAVYQESLDEKEFKSELKELQKKWISIQVLQK